LSLTVFTQRNFVADFLQAKCDFTPKTAVLRFEPPFAGLRNVRGGHLRLIGKRALAFRYKRILVQNRRFPSNGGRLTQNFR